MHELDPQETWPDPPSAAQTAFPPRDGSRPAQTPCLKVPAAPAPSLQQSCWDETGTKPDPLQGAPGPALLFGVSVGPGDPELMTFKAARILRDCPVLAAPVGRPGASSLALQIAQGAVGVSSATHEILELVLPMTRDQELLRSSHEDAAARIEEQLRQGKDVTFVCLGDISVYSTFSHIRKLVLRDGFAVQAVAGVPSFCAVAAALDMPLGSRPDSCLHVIPGSAPDLEECLDAGGCKVIIKSGTHMQRVLDLLRKKDLLAHSALVIDCGLPTQRVVPNLACENDLEGLLGLSARPSRTAKTAAPSRPLGAHSRGRKPSYFVTILVHPS